MAVAFFGDGAANNGAFHEGLNMASIWKLPVLFICENNQFATEVPFAYAAGNPNVASRAAGYGIPGFKMDGERCIRASLRRAGEAVDARVRRSAQHLIECKTYRTRAHAEGMGDFGYRTREDVEPGRTCPILTFRSEVCSAKGCRLQRQNRLPLMPRSKAEVEAQARLRARPGRRPETARRQHIYAEFPPDTGAHRENRNRAGDGAKSRT